MSQIEKWLIIAVLEGPQKHEALTMLRKALKNEDVQASAGVPRALGKKG